MSSHTESIVEYISAHPQATREDLYRHFLDEGVLVSDIEDAERLASGESQKVKNQARTRYVVSVFGALFIGAGVFSFVASNWEVMGDYSKVLTILIAMLGFYGSGMYIREAQGFLRTGNALLFAGALSYGAGIFLVAQIYNIRAEWPDGFILWMLGVLPLAVLLRAKLLYALGAFLGVISVIGFPIDIFDGGRSALGPYFLTSNVLLLIATVVLFVVTHYLFIKKPTGVESI